MGLSTGRLLLIASLATLLGAAGCGDHEPSDPTDEDGGVDASGFDPDREDGGDREDGSVPGDAGDDPDAASEHDAGDAGPMEMLSARELCDRLIDEGRRVLCDDADDDDACDAALRPGTTRCEAILTAIEQGRLAFDGAAAHVCVATKTSDELANAFSGFYLPCDDVFRGLIPADEPCYYDYGFAAQECEAGTYCDWGEMCPGQCRHFQLEGDPCPSAGACDPTLTCLRDCELPCEGTCGPRPGVGESCEASSGACADDLICDATMEPHTCIVRRRDGESCTRSYQCESFTCVAGECGTAPELECVTHSDCEDDEYCDPTEFTCEPRAGQDEPCGGYTLCDEGLECMYAWDDSGEFCRARAGIDGESCLPWGCEPDHYCANETGVLTCRPDRGMGESCRDEDMSLGIGNPSCQEGLHCMHSNDGTCLPPGELDEPCYYNDTGSCVDGLVCLGWGDSTCQPPSALGERCSPAFDDACAEGTCDCMMIDESCDWFCVETLDNGEPCEESRYCTSGYCDISLADPVCADDPGPDRACLPED